MQERYYLLNNKIPIVSNRSINEVKTSLIRYYNFNIQKLIEISKKTYEKIIISNGYENCPSKH